MVLALTPFGVNRPGAPKNDALLNCYGLARSKWLCRLSLLGIDPAYGKTAQRREANRSAGKMTAGAYNEALGYVDLPEMWGKH